MTTFVGTRHGRYKEVLLCSDQLREYGHILNNIKHAFKQLVIMTGACSSEESLFTIVKVGVPGMRVESIVCSL